VHSDDEVLLVMLAAGSTLEVYWEDGRHCQLGPHDAVWQALAVGLPVQRRWADVIVVRLNRQSAA
jgi:hypothetical protein